MSQHAILKTVTRVLQKFGVFHKTQRLKLNVTMSCMYWCQGQTHKSCPINIPHITNLKLTKHACQAIVSVPMNKLSSQSDMCISFEIFCRQVIFPALNETAIPKWQYSRPFYIFVLSAINWTFTNLFHMQSSNIIYSCSYQSTYQHAKLKSNRRNSDLCNND